MIEEGKRRVKRQGFEEEIEELPVEKMKDCR